jgi:hypothetical protein
MYSLNSQNYENYGIDWDSPVPAIENEGAVNPPKITCPLVNDDYVTLVRLINPMNQSDSFGIDIYIATVNYISQQLTCHNGFLMT